MGTRPGTWERVGGECLLLEEKLPRDDYITSFHPQAAGCVCVFCVNLHYSVDCLFLFSVMIVKVNM